MLVGLSSLVFADPGNIRYTKHNLSSTLPTAPGFNVSRGYNSSNVTQICIFCHTPHNAQPSQPLWNKVLPADRLAFRLYTSSGTLSPTAKGAELLADSPSLLCLSCHDGKTAVNIIHNVGYAPHGTTSTGKPVLDIFGMYNNPAGGGAPTEGISMGFFGGYGSYGANLGSTAANQYDGTNLTNDHPIGFSYSNAAAENTNLNRLYDVPNVIQNSSGKIRFFSPNNRIECSSCHDPHVSYEDGAPSPSNTALRPFLVMSNAGSAMCLSCHKK